MKQTALAGLLALASVVFGGGNGAYAQQALAVSEMTIRKYGIYPSEMLRERRLDVAG